MATSATKRTQDHAAAWDRLTPEVVFSSRGKLTPEELAVFAAKHAYAVYQDALQARFRGRDYGEAAIARLYWLRCESTLVNLRARQRKPNEFSPSRRRGQR
jgi:hypothetical protein